MRAAPSLLIPLAFALCGCGAKAQQVGGTPRFGAPPRVVSLSPSTTEIIATDLDARFLVGRTESDDYPTNVVRVPVVAGVKPDFEKIKASGAALVVYDADLYSADDIKRIEAMGIKSFAFKDHTIIGFEKELYGLATALGNETNVSGYVDRIERERSAAEGDRPTTAPKVAVVLGGGDYVAGKDSFVADIVKAAGGVPVGPASPKFDRMGAEALVADAPDIIIIATTKATAAKDLAALQSSAGLSTSPAVKKGRIAAVDASVVSRRGSRVDKLIASIHKEIVLGQKAKG